MLGGFLEETLCDGRIHGASLARPAGVERQKSHHSKAVGDFTGEDPTETLIEGLTMQHQFFVLVWSMGPLVIAESCCEEEVSFFVSAGIARVKEREGFPYLGIQRSLLGQFTPNGIEGCFVYVSSSFDNLPRVSFQGIAPLANQHHTIPIIQG
jgi:hypothetical protein